MSEAEIHLRQFSTGQLLTLEPTGQGGGEGKIYRVREIPEWVAKVYHPKKRTPEQLAKLRAMLANPPADPAGSSVSIAWPLDLVGLRDRPQAVVGFLMPRVADMRPIHDFYTPKTRRQELPGLTYRYLLRIARNLAAAVSALHDRGYAIGDVNESNILAGKTSLVALVDTDSFQVPDPQNQTTYRCPVGKPEFTPPELQGKNFRNVDRRPEHDCFGLAIVIFQLLMEGTHPFDGVYRGRGDPPPKQHRIAAGHFPYGAKPGPYAPKPIAPPIAFLEPALQDLFVQAFVAGFRRPERRPSARTWVAALEDAEQRLTVCQRNNLHTYPSHLSHCFWCDRASQFKGRDPFPSREAVRRGDHLKPVAPRKRSRTLAPAQPRSPKGWLPRRSRTQVIAIPKLQPTATVNPLQYWLSPGYSTASARVSLIGFSSCILVALAIILGHHYWDFSTPGLPLRIPAQSPSVSHNAAKHKVAIAQFDETQATLEQIVSEVERALQNRFPTVSRSVLKAKAIRALILTLGDSSLIYGNSVIADYDANRDSVAFANQRQAWIEAIYTYQRREMDWEEPLGYFDSDRLTAKRLAEDTYQRVLEEIVTTPATSDRFPGSAKESLSF